MGGLPRSPAKSIALQVDQATENISGKMDMDIPVRLNLGSQVAETQENDQVDAMTQQLSQVRLTIQLRVNCRCAKEKGPKLYECD